MAIGESRGNEVELDLKIEDYFFDGKSPFNDTLDACYVPIFVSDARQDFAVFRSWFLGNMFLDKYYIVNSMVDVKIPYGPAAEDKPEVGIYNKYTHSVQAK
jgi:hypothetical protein